MRTILLCNAHENYSSGRWERAFAVIVLCELKNHENALNDEQCCWQYIRKVFDLSSEK